MLIAVTGNLCSGKSTFLGFVKKLGFRTVDSDKIVAGLYRARGVSSAVRKAFGEAAFSGGRISRKKLGRIVFAGSKKIAKLNKMIHPLVRKKILSLGHGKRIVFVEVPLLFEARMQGLFWKTILISCPKKTAFARALKKGFSKRDVVARSRFQGWAGRKTAKSDFIINSSCTLGRLRLAAQLITTELLKTIG